MGPVIEYEKINLNETNSIGIVLSFDLPVLNQNAGGKEVAAKEILYANQSLKNTKDKNARELEILVAKYQSYYSSLQSLANAKNLEKKHAKIESLFKRGIVSTSLVIESHRQLIEFFRTKFEFETNATKSLWNIYLLTGEIENKRL